MRNRANAPPQRSTTSKTIAKTTKTINTKRPYRTTCHSRHHLPTPWHLRTLIAFVRRTFRRGILYICKSPCPRPVSGAGKRDKLDAFFQLKYRPGGHWHGLLANDSDKLEIGCLMRPTSNWTQPLLLKQSPTLSSVRMSVCPSVHPTFTCTNHN